MLSTSGINNKRILYVGGFQLPDKNAAATRVLNVGRLLREGGFNTTFLDIDKRHLSSELSKLHYTDGFDTYSQAYPTCTRQWIRYSLNPLHAKEVLSKHDDWFAVIAYNYPALALRRLKTICRNRGIKILADCTEWTSPSSLSFHNLMVELDTFLRMRIIHKSLDGLIAISTFLQKYYQSSLSVIHLPPMMDCQKMNQKVTPQTDGFLRLLYAGDIKKREKDKLTTIINSVANSGDAKVLLNIVGITKEDFLKTFSNYNRFFSKESKIIFHGRLPHEKVLEILRQSDYTIFCRPVTRLTNAGFPTKLTESLSCGIPVITNKTSDIEQYITPEANGFLLDTKFFEEEFLQLLKNGSLHCKPKVERNLFDYHNYIDTFCSWLNHL